jgi:hypothetical protein
MDFDLLERIGHCLCRLLASAKNLKKAQLISNQGTNGQFALLRNRPTTAHDFARL